MATSIFKRADLLSLYFINLQNFVVKKTKICILGWMSKFALGRLNATTPLRGVPIAIKLRLKLETAKISSVLL
uniref:Uncharacterized protein n=1 Tax=Desertifilum tharense IPPAS B-1220 TaxID=1781255 RepID=A0A1E5QRL1_9CYAN|nr:hypothetical protein BH720_00130 [Desertifilum tharense IPPAS B-1220]